MTAAEIAYALAPVSFAAGLLGAALLLATRRGTKPGTSSAILLGGLVLAVLGHLLIGRLLT